MPSSNKMLTMKNCLKNLFFVASLLFSSVVASQNLLTKSAAVEQAFGQNLSVRLARNSVQIAENNTSVFNTGQLPTVSANAGVDLDEGGSRFDYNDGSSLKANGATSLSSSASLGVNYLIYDGKARALNIERLRESKATADLELRQSMEFTALQLLNSYYQVAQLTENVALQKEALEVSKQRLERTRYQYEYGQGIRLNVLNAEVDLQRDSVNLLNLEAQLENARRSLNALIGRPADTQFDIDTTVVYGQGLSLDAILKQALQNNVQLLLAEQDLLLSEYDLRLAETTNRPRISANATYAYALKDNDTKSTIDWQNTRGLNLGLSLRWDLFDGGIRRTRMANSRVLINNQQLLKDQLLLDLERDVRNAWQNYQTALFVLDTERRNLATARLNFERSQGQFRLGQIISVEFRQAQLNLLAAATNLSIAKYNAKRFELELLQLSGALLVAEF